MPKLDPKTIKRIRLALGRTQEELANVLGTTAITVGRWERGSNAPSPIFTKHLNKLDAYVKKHNPSKKGEE